MQNKLRGRYGTYSFVGYEQKQMHRMRRCLRKFNYRHRLGLPPTDDAALLLRQTTEAVLLRAFRDHRTPGRLRADGLPLGVNFAFADGWPYPPHAAAGQVLDELDRDGFIARRVNAGGHVEFEKVKPWVAFNERLTVTLLNARVTMDRLDLFRHLNPEPAYG